MKYNGLLANLTTCLNSYIIFGKEFIENNETNVNLLLEMIWKAITLNPQGGDQFLMDESNAEFQKYELNFSNNIEGCLVLSLVLQNFDNSANYPLSQKLPLII